MGEERVLLCVHLATVGALEVTVEHRRGRRAAGRALLLSRGRLLLGLRAHELVRHHGAAVRLHLLLHRRELVLQLHRLGLGALVALLRRALRLARRLLGVLQLALAVHKILQHELKKREEVDNVVWAQALRVLARQARVRDGLDDALERLDPRLAGEARGVDRGEQRPVQALRAHSVPERLPGADGPACRRGGRSGGGRDVHGSRSGPTMK
mmetsp:Transcript_14908/g.46220  ORF Transcript_14908/g.46220 Transcript_14908/m.46220 type:complete len:211 (-) Transcript_14908:93-725(-)